MTNSNLTEIVMDAFSNLWQVFLVFVPKIIIALLIFLIGWVIAAGIGRLVSEILKRLRFNQVFERGVYKEALDKADFRVDVSEFIGALVKWIFVIVFLLISVEILGLGAFATFLTTILEYLPNVVVAALIFVVAVIIADFAEKAVRAGVESTKVGYGHLAGSIVKWSIWIFAFMAILRQLLIVPQMVDTLFNALIYGTVALLVIAGGIAFGLGGKDIAGEILRDLKKKIKE